MSLENNNLNRARVYVEPAGSYAVDHTGTPGDFQDFPYLTGTLEAVRLKTPLAQTTSQIYLDEKEEQLYGPQTNTVGFSSYLVSHGQLLDGDVTPTASGSIGLFDILQAALGGRQDTTNVGAQTLVTGTPSATVFDVTASHGPRFTPGAVVMVNNEVREVKSVATDTVTLKEALSAAPSVSDVVYGGVTMYLTENDSANDTSLQFLVEGRENNDGWAYFGCQMNGLSFTLTPGELVQMALSFAGAGWSTYTPSLAAADLSMYSAPIAAFPMILHVPTIGSTTLTNICPFDSVEVSPDITWGPVTCASATNNISQMIRQMPAESVCSGSFTTSFEDLTWHNAWVNSTDHAFFLQIGNQPGSTVFISCPTIQITNVTDSAVSGDIRGQKVEWRARHDAEIASPANELERSAFRISFL